MRRFQCALLSAVAVIGFASIASAADLPVKAPITKAPSVASSYDWTGFYVGANCGGAWAHATSNNTGPDFFGFDTGVPTSHDVKAPGWTCGGQLGYNWQMGRWLFGLEGDMGYLGIDRSEFIQTDTTLVAVKYGGYAAATGRIGYTWDRALFYGKGGVALARIRNTASDVNTDVIDFTDFSEETHTRFGWVVGGGIEYGLNANWSIKGEYLYMDFGKFTTGLNLDGDTFEHRNSIQTLKLGVNYRFAPSAVFAKY